MAAYLGLDWTDNGWLGVGLAEGGGYDVDLYPAVSSAWVDHPDARRVLIDVPIGLVDDDRRRCEEVAARYLAPERHQSIFWTPVREAVLSRTLAAAKRINRRAIGQSVQNQAWRQCPRIREVDDFIELLPEATVGTLRESHPEVCFWAFNDGRPLADSKHADAGLERRLELLESRHDLAAEIYDDAVETFIEPPPHARRLGADGRADVLDALALAVTAATSDRQLRRIPADPQRDERGGYTLDVEMVIPAVPRRAEQVSLDAVAGRSRP
ncbi:MAG: DUF429 domain-containing protein [Halobacteriales archaeon]